MSWVYLFIAAVFEIGWPTGLKMAELSSHKLYWILFAIFAMIFSGVFLYLAQKEIPIGTAYAVWTGIGAACTFLAGIFLFQEPMSMMRFFGIFLIIAGVFFLKFGH